MKALGGLALALVSGALLAVLTPLLSTAGSRGAVPALPAPGAQVSLPEVEWSLDIRLHPETGKLEPPAELLLTDPAGRRLGKAPGAGHAVAEIPRSHYQREGLDDCQTGAPGPQSAALYLNRPVPGDYHLQVLGREDGRYDLEVAAFGPNPRPAKALITDTAIRQGERQIYRLILAPPPAVTVTVSPVLPPVSQ